MFQSEGKDLGEEEGEFENNESVKKPFQIESMKQVSSIPDSGKVFKIRRKGLTEIHGGLGRRRRD